MWQATGWRRADWDTPLWALPNTRAGRYNAAGTAPTQYVCLHPWAPWAEVLRWEDRRTAQEAAELAGRVWSVQVSLPEPPAEITFDAAADWGVSAEELVAEDYRACQQLAQQAKADRHAALLVPSAALPGTRTLVLFGPRVLIAWQLLAVDPHLDVPAAVTADGAGPPLAVLPHVRWRGAAHAGLQAWQGGTPLSFLEPVPTPLPRAPSPTPPFPAP